jgi:HAD superfamily hydrolase (TIGR01509 family)
VNDAAPRIQACIFDLDGTIVDSEPNYAASDEVFFRDYGIVLSDEFVASMLGRGTLDFFRILEGLFPESPLVRMPLEERIALRDTRYLEYSATRMKVFPALAALVKELAARSMPLALASGSSRRVIEQVLSSIGLKDFFSAIISSSEVGKGKPDPEIFLLAASRLGVDPKSVLVFEDSRAGVEGASNAGMHCIALPVAHADLALFSTADVIVRGGPDAATLRGLLDAIDLISRFPARNAVPPG